MRTCHAWHKGMGRGSREGEAPHYPRGAQSCTRAGPPLYVPTCIRAAAPSQEECCLAANEPQFDVGLIKDDKFFIKSATPMLLAPHAASPTPAFTP